VHPLKRSAWQLLTGSIPGKDPEPVAWTNMYGKSRVFYTSLGHPDDFKNEHFRKLLINAAFWCMKTSIPRQ
jgi:type 1 glutamine amidotransferase